jgi:hypothetical protein
MDKLDNHVYGVDNHVVEFRGTAVFVDHTLESAPDGSRRSMEATVRRLGYLPAPVARLAESRHLLDGFLKLNGMFEARRWSRSPERS